MVNYFVVLFKNKLKKKIIKKFVTLKKATQFYEKKLVESDDVIFDVIVENGQPSQYEIGIIELSSRQLVPVYMTDEMGRSKKVKLDEDGMTLFKITQFKKEESLFDIQTNKRIFTQEFIKKYLKSDGLKMVSVLNNKIVVQNDDVVNLFSCKNETESSRFIDCLSNHFFKIKRGDCLFIKDYSTPQRKYLYSLLESKGYDKKVLYRKFTTYSNPSK